MPLILDAAAATDTGPRSDNQDSGCAGSTLIAVADGVSGNAGGAVASALVVGCLVARWSEAPPVDVQVALVDAIAAANRRIRDAIRERPDLRTMATTLTAMTLGGEGDLAVAHIGDSSGFLLRNGELSQLTRNQTVVQALVDAGSISADQARTHPMRSVLESALRGDDDDLAALQVTTVPVGPGDRLLLCSDGLSGFLAPELIHRVLGTEASPQDVAAGLLREALGAPTSDNVTVVVADVVEGEERRPAGFTVVGAAAWRSEATVSTPVPD